MTCTASTMMRTALFLYTQQLMFTQLKASASPWAEVNISRKQFERGVKDENLLRTYLGFRKDKILSIYNSDSEREQPSPEDHPLEPNGTADHESHLFITDEVYEASRSKPMNEAVENPDPPKTLKELEKDLSDNQIFNLKLMSYVHLFRGEILFDNVFKPELAEFKYDADTIQDIKFEFQEKQFVTTEINNDTYLVGYYLHVPTNFAKGKTPSNVKFGEIAGKTASRLIRGLFFSKAKSPPEIPHKKDSPLPSWHKSVCTIWTKIPTGDTARDKFDSLTFHVRLHRAIDASNVTEDEGYVPDALKTALEDPRNPLLNRPETAALS